jgi:hypothetical protein
LRLLIDCLRDVLACGLNATQSGSDNGRLLPEAMTRRMTTHAITSMMERRLEADLQIERNVGT